MQFENYECRPAGEWGGRTIMIQHVMKATGPSVNVPLRSGKPWAWDAQTNIHINADI